MPAFAGFPAGPTPYVPLPEAFFTHLLPEIEDSGELKLTLHLFWLLAQQRGDSRCASDRELLGDPLLRRALRRRGDPRPPEERLRAALELALARGTLLRVRVRVDGEIVTWYFFNTARSREAIERLMSGEDSPERLLDLEGPAGGPRDADGTPLVVEIERPNIFTLYEQNIGLLLPLVAEELREAGERYPADWLEAAFREAVQQNRRSWAYIRAILKRWEADGKGGQPYGAHGRYPR
ncbi:MAG TPA: DnaD domain protein [Ktedonobacterales bacterium]|jgi:DnaD/phage-associated family protein